MRARPCACSTPAASTTTCSCDAGWRGDHIEEQAAFQGWCIERMAVAADALAPMIGHAFSVSLKAILSHIACHGRVMGPCMSTACPLHFSLVACESNCVRHVHCVSSDKASCLRIVISFHFNSLQDIMCLVTVSASLIRQADDTQSRKPIGLCSTRHSRRRMRCRDHSCCLSSMSRVSPSSRATVM
jgi:hypothetical protein